MADPKDRLVELRAERARLVDEREKARAEATDDLIAGKKPASTAAALVERISIVDDAIERLNADASDAAERAFMNELIGEGLENFSSNRLVPSGEFPIQFPPKRLDGPDVVDQMADMLRGRLG